VVGGELLEAQRLARVEVGEQGDGGVVVLRVGLDLGQRVAIDDVVDSGGQLEPAVACREAEQRAVAGGARGQRHERPLLEALAAARVVSRLRLARVRD
jgi:hypothetical protein